jgi:hypothetical protein
MNINRFDMVWYAFSCDNKFSDYMSLLIIIKMIKLCLFGMKEK